VETEPFSETFGPKAQRKKPRVEASSFEELCQISSAAVTEADEAAYATGTNVSGAPFDFL